MGRKSHEETRGEDPEVWTIKMGTQETVPVFPGHTT